MDAKLLQGPFVTSWAASVEACRGDRITLVVKAEAEFCAKKIEDFGVWHWPSSVAPTAAIRVNAGLSFIKLQAQRLHCLCLRNTTLPQESVESCPEDASKVW